MVDFKVFLEANGHNYKKLGHFNSDPEISVGKEIFACSIIDQAAGEELVRKEKVGWNSIKNQVVHVHDRRYENPWAHRFAYGGKNASAWQDEVRRIGKCGHNR